MRAAWTFVGMVLLLSGACARSLKQDQQATTIADALASNSDLSVLLEAVNTFPELSGPANDSATAFTVFAPTNEAILSALSRLGVGSLQDFVGKYPVLNILTYHILPTVVKSTDLKTGQPVFTSLPGGRLIPDLSASNAPIIRGRDSAAKIITADVLAGNAVIHIVDNVLLPINPVPPKYATVADAAIDAKLTSLLAAVEKANLTAALSDENLVATVFAPNNQAFDKALADINQTLDSIPNDVLTAVLKYHIAPGYGPTWRMVADGTKETMLANQTLQWSYPMETAMYPTIKAGSSEANIVTPDVFAGKCVVHIIDYVLLPKTE